ncbi:TMEM175 family protein [Methanospirillum stamsii]|uniref:DUF1211 domain-containing protein n=1 Tax=Methanospirillum stamsii TaxID=1277351 RepID=A0A2V2N8G8_9EURY|nr:TMEM175 family protein [Methanospirillum stamsii]PWR74970.1 hypothetical protein DLD82_07010 [Methanospirillum stamsii]
MKSRDLYHALISSDSEHNPHRLEAFFDAVYAIALTILVLGISLPEHSQSLTIFQIFNLMIPQLYHFALAFFILAAFWIAHHRFFIFIKKVNPMFIRITFVTLFITCLLPFTSTLAGDYHTDPTSVVFFYSNLLILGLLFLVQWLYAKKAGLTIHVPDDMSRYIIVKLLFVPIIAGIAIIVAFYSTVLSSLCFLLIVLKNIFMLPFLPKETEITGNSPEDISEDEISIRLEKDPGLSQLLTEVSHEMDLTREDLLLKILQRWKDETEVNVGEKGKLCQL